MLVDDETTNLNGSQDGVSLDSNTQAPPSTPKSNNKRKMDSISSPEIYKRPRNDSLTYKKHPQFWALDGNLLLQIDHTRFKLHRSRLATQSPWFDGLFQRKAGVLVDLGDYEAGVLGVLLTAQDVDGCELYHLNSTGVELKNFVHLLSAMDDAIGFYHNNPDFLVVAAIHRVADAFNFPQFLDFTTKYITAKFPADVKAVGEQELDFAVEAVLLGRNCGLPSILKRSFYELARRNPIEDESDNNNNGKADSESSDDSSDGSSDSGDQESTDSESDNEGNGIKAKVQSKNRQEGVSVAGGDAGQIAKRKGTNPIDKDEDGAKTRDNLLLLDPADLVRLLSARKQLTRSWFRVFSWKPNCSKKKAKCIKLDLQANWQVIHSSGLISNYERDPICGIEKLCRINWNEKGYCEPCVADIVTHLKEQRNYIWNKLGSWFGL